MEGMYRTIAFLLATCIAFTPGFGWTNHGLGTFLSLYSIRSFSQSPFVRVETLESFLDAERSGLEELLPEIEEELARRIAHYPKHPQGIRFGRKSQDLRMDFLDSLRLNPNTRLGYYVQEMPGIRLSKPTYPHSEITSFQDYKFLEKDVFVEAKVGSIQSPLYVLATAVDEPDYGMDVGLFEDNGTEFGQRYGFGIQSFGDPRYEYSSQAPFHMGFYSEGKMIYTFAGFLAKTYPEARAYQFLRLSRFAFQRGHEYWGYRFLGWGLHYIQDLTQPYHARVLPQYSPGKMIRINLAAIIGLSAGKTGAVERVSTRHNFIETYLYEEIRVRMKKGRTPQDPVYAAFAKKEVGEIPEDIFDYPRLVARESFTVSDEFDKRIESFASGFLGQDWEYSKLPKNESRESLDTILMELSENFGYHTRVILEWAKKK